MATISAPDLVLLRTQQQSSVGYLSILQPTVLLTAAVTGAPTRGQRAISYNGGSSSSFSTIEEGQTIIFNTAYGIFRGRLKAIAGVAANGTITLDENGFLLTNGDTITIYHNYEVHPIPPAIRSQVFYKFYDTAYSNQNSQPNPVAIAGPHKVGWLTTGTVTRRIQVGTDDGYVRPAGFPQYFSTSSTIEFGSAGGVDRNAWLRFQDIQIPNAAIIKSATISVYASGNQSTTVALNVYGEDADNPTAPTSLADYNGRAVTSAVAWNFSTAWVSGTAYSTPSLVTPVQAIVNRAGWASGNAMQFFIKNNGGADSRLISAIENGSSVRATLTITFVSSVATFSLNATPSYAIASGATISSYAWTCVHNGGATTGIAFSNPAIANPTLTISEVGQYWLKLVVTDSNGKTQSTYRALWVYDRSGTLLPYLDFTVQSLGGDWQTGGWKCSLQATGDVDLTDFPDWTLVVISYDNFFNGVEDYVNLWSSGDNVIIAGYLRQDTDNDDFSQGTGNVSFQITTIDDLLNNICELGTVSLNAVASPTKWYEYASWMIAGRSIHHLIRWQSWGVLETCDVLGLTDNTLGVKNTDYSESSLLQQVNVFAYQRGIFAKLISNRLGQMYLVADTQMLNTAQRAALDTIFTITTADISGTIDVVRSPEQTVVFAQLDGFKFNGSASTPYVSIVPGYRESSVSYIIPNERGSSIVSVSNQVLDSQTDANEKIGRYVALANNNPRELRFSTPGNYLGCFDIIPSQGWYAWGISDVSLKRDTELNGKLFVCRNVSHSLDFQSGVIQTSVVLEKEAIGPDGIQGNYPTGYPTVSLPTPTWNTGGANTSLADFLLAFSNGSVSNQYITAGRYSGGTISLSAAAVQFCANTGTSRAFVCGLSGTKGIVFYFNSTAGEARARTVIIDNSLVITLGAEQTIEATGLIPSDCISLSDSKILLALEDVGASQDYVLAASVSGDTITPGSPVALETNAVSTRLARLSSSLGVATYIISGAPNDSVRAVPVSISGTTATLETAGDVSTAYPSVSGVNIVSLDNTTAIVFYIPNSDDLRACAIYNVSSSFTVGTDILLNATAFPTLGGSPFTTRLLSTEVIYSFIGASDSIAASSVTYSGSGNISDGSDVTVANKTNECFFPCLAAISSNRIIAGYIFLNDAASAWEMAVQSLTYSGTLAADGNEVIVDSDIGIATVNYPAIAQLRTPS